MNLKPPIRVVIVDDHEMILQSLVRLISADARFVIVGSALTAVDGIEVLKRELPDVLVIDYQLPDMDAPEAIRIVRQILPEIKIVTFSGADRPGALYASMKAGSSAWVRKTRAIQELRDAITLVMRGDPFANDEIETLPKLEELEVHYQPIVDLECGRIAGFEALVRWRHPQRGLLHPDAFLLLAEQTGYIEEIDRWVRERAVHQLAQWQKQFPTMLPLWMSVNLSVSDLGDSELVSSIANLIARTGISASSLVIEITESVLLDDTQQTHNFLRRISDLGVGLALDDFGTAFSSVSYIHRFPFNHLKLDISFTDELPHSLRSMLLVEEIGHLADSMKMTGTAEGIERQDQLDALREIGWKFGQGYLFSPALPADECEQLFARSSMFPQLSDLAN